jgi:hypothetical protein
MEFVGETMPSDWILADVHLSGLPNPAEINISWHSAGILATFPIVPPRYRVIADVKFRRRCSHDPTLAEVQAILDERAPGGITASNRYGSRRFTSTNARYRNIVWAVCF